MEEHAGDKQKISIKFMPGVPDRIMEQVKVDIAHFEPILFPIYGHGIFTNVSSNFQERMPTMKCG